MLASELIRPTGTIKLVVAMIQCCVLRVVTGFDKLAEMRLAVKSLLHVSCFCRDH